MCDVETWTYYVESLLNIFVTTVSYYLMSRKFKIRDQEAVHFVAFTTIHWLDPPVVGQAIFTRVEYHDIFLDSIRYCQKNEGLEVYAYCIMSSHVRMIIARHGTQQYAVSILAAA